MKNITVDVVEFSEQFDKECAFLYKNNDNVAGYKEALEYGNKFMAENKKFIGDFVKYRGDLISSDREVVAFMFALQSIGCL